MVRTICKKNESNLTNRYWDMVPDRQKVRADRRTHGRRQNFIPPTSSRDYKNNNSSKNHDVVKNLSRNSVIE